MRIPIKQPPTAEEKRRGELRTYEEKKKIDVEYAGKREKLIQGIRVQYKGKKPDKVDVQIWGAARKQAEGEAKQKAHDDYMAGKPENYMIFSSAEIPPAVITVERVMEIYKEMMQTKSPTNAKAEKPSVFDDLATFVKEMLSGEKEPPR